jgi:archaemetzincin
VTLVDLYPGINWNYVFGWANFGRGSGVFSFKRYHPDYDEWNTHSYDDYIRLACHTMVHECCHMFALWHCPFYECLMNGYNSLDEQLERKNNTLCPICLKKLKLNIGFDVRQRFENLLKAATQLKFTKEIQQYQELLDRKYI